MFTFDSVTAAAMGINVNQGSISGIPEIRNNLEVLDARDGVHDFGSTLHAKFITFECNFPQNSSYSTMMSLIDNLNKYFNPKYGLKRLDLDSQTDRHYMARLYTRLDITKVVRTAGLFNLTFIVPSGYAIANTVTAHNFSSTGNNTIVVSGSTNTKPVITVQADLIEGENGLLTLNFNSDEYIIILHEVLDAAKHLVIDCVEATVDYNTISPPATESGLTKINRFALPELPPGNNNLNIAITGTSSALTNIKIEHFDRWL